MLLALALVTLAPAGGWGAPVDAPLREQAAEALRRAVRFFDREVSVRGTYLWQYSEDLSRREGEGRATATQGWVQPPGTPAVGLALLEAWQLCGEALCLQAATNTAAGLIWGQLRSGGWAYHIDFDPQSGRPLAYRHLPQPPARARNYAILDDDTTMAALRFLMRLDQALQFKHQPVHEAVVYGLTNLLSAQRPNGGFPQVFDRPADPALHPARRAAYPPAWPRQHPGGDYHNFYTLNDNVHADVLNTLWEAARVYSSTNAGAPEQALAARCRTAARHGADFLVLAQMPEPQPAWAQQYNAEMHPAWARRFEPPSITGSESQSAIRALLRAYRETGDARFLEPIPRALAYLQRSRLPDGRLARFYELQSNRPLYFTKDYQLTYDDGDVPTHYAFKIGDDTARLAREYDTLRQQLPAPVSATPKPPPPPRLDAALEASVRAILAAQDARGRWVEKGKLRYHGADDPTTQVIRTETFMRNIATLARFLAASHAAGQ